MDYYSLKIKEKFLNPIRNRIKRHEYRLGTPERRKIRIGDVLILTSNHNKNDYVKAIVKSICDYKSWEEPINKYWENELKFIYETKEEAINDCSKFYSQNQVKENGIIVYEIDPYVKELSRASVLLDTNIVIHRESSNNIAYEVIQLYRELDNLKATKCILGDIKTEIKKYKDKQVVDNMLAKLGAYCSVEAREIVDPNFEKVISKHSKDDNSIIDNKFLYLVYKGVVDYLITDDKGILRKAEELKIDDFVLSASSFLRIVEEKYPSLIEYKVLSVKLDKFSSIDINDDFFETLRADYGGIKFNDWFNKKTRNSENAYVFRNENGLQGFLYLKLEDENEDYSDIEPIFKPGKRLKVGTFKINSTGLRVGERFLKIIFDYAEKSDVEEIYVTMFENKRTEIDQLIKLMMDWGFEKYGYRKSNGELVMVKKMKNYRYDKDPKFNYPILKPNASHGVLPIDAQFHTDLFPDLYLTNENMSLFEEKPCGYAVEKIYVCSSKSIPLRPGDLMAIYRMSEKFYKSYNSVVSGVCVLQGIIYSRSFDEYIKECGNRTVFTREQLEYFYNEKDYKTIIKVLFLKPLNRKIVLNDLYENDIINNINGPRLRTKITNDGFEKLLELGEVLIK